LRSDNGTARFVDFFLRAVADKDRLTLPHYRHRLAFLESRNIDFCNREGERIGSWVHGTNKRPCRRACTHASHGARRQHEEIASFRIGISVPASILTATVFAGRIHE